MPRPVFFLVCAYLLAFCLLLPTRLAVPAQKTFSNDAASYTKGATYLVTENFYSTDGVTPAVEREPGYSFFLSIIYRVFGIENRFAIFAVQGLLHLLATLFFVRQLRTITSKRAAIVSAVFLLLLPSVYHIVFTVYRESFVLSLSMVFAGLLISMRKRPEWPTAVLVGALFSWMLLTHISFLLFPLILGTICMILPQFPRRMLVPIVALPMLAALLWGIRNEVHGGEFRLMGSIRLAAVVERRAIQASTFDPFDPLRCRWAEYITRDYSKSSPYCGMRYTDVLGGRAVEKRVISQGESTILHHLPMYLWDSVWFAAEMHLPYVDGWGKFYNVLESIATILLYAGCALALKKIWRREFALFIALLVYLTALSAASEAVPRYHMVPLFCTAALAGVGYAELWTWLRRRRYSGE